MIRSVDQLFEMYHSGDMDSTTLMNVLLDHHTPAQEMSIIDWIVLEMQNLDAVHGLPNDGIASKLLLEVKRVYLLHLAAFGSRVGDPSFTAYIRLGIGASKTTRQTYESIEDKEGFWNFVNYIDAQLCVQMG